MIEYQKELGKIYKTKLNINYSKLNWEIVLYGAGSLGCMAYNLLKKKHIYPQYIVDKNRSGEIDGNKIIRPEAIDLYDKQNYLFIICISTISFNEIVNELEKIGIYNYMHFYTYAFIKMPSLLSNGWFVSRVNKRLKKNIEDVCELLSHDDMSLAHYMQFVWWKLKLIEHPYIGFDVLSHRKYFKSPCFSQSFTCKVLIDGGCHYGQTIDEFIKYTHGVFKQIFAFDADIDNLNIAKKNIDERVKYSDNALWNKNGKIRFFSDLGFASKIDKAGNIYVRTVAIDNLEIQPDIIKLHLEGAELNALNGARKTIKKYRPILMVVADHSSDGLYKIPLFLSKFKNYIIYFYLHDYCGNSAVFYSIPSELIRQNKQQ